MIDKVVKRDPMQTLLGILFVAGLIITVLLLIFTCFGAIVPGAITAYIYFCLQKFTDPVQFAKEHRRCTVCAYEWSEQPES